MSEEIRRAAFDAMFSHWAEAGHSDEEMDRFFHFYSCGYLDALEAGA